MLSQLTLFFFWRYLFLFGIVQTAAFFIMWTPPLPHPALRGKDFPSERKRGGGRRTRAYFSFLSSRQYCCVMTSRGRHFTTDGLCFGPPPNPFEEPALAFFLRTRYSASRGVETLTLLPGQQAALLEKDLHPLGSFVASFEPMGTRSRSVIAPAEGAHQPPHPPPPPLRPPPVSLAALLSSRRASPQAIFFSWLKGKRWKKKKKKTREKRKKKIFGGFRAVISNQSSAILKDESTFE